ncbi:MULTISPECIES: transcription antitermination factor NusB [Leptolyngbya]|uniref:Transcription antitermination protein NusB n=3 Tax=Leptolyngbya group TaxID=3081713 RepID=A0A1Z4JLJ0_LEPBY|nr:MULTISPECIES: transcription antitermination factor NusB [Leptolyngbya]MBD2374072.1 transcription antitermination protein NusB [Leptolyngbya sp. FACHB-238]BAY57591.1 transcription antitermination protein NusB [Leptolyngbya boryana NIES-2135]MBD1858287.1 transcription antitermination protein NusB [Leptolyngbya sp. FACHB-1624]MBD2367548.1 transcription antitermination protein NusB [Leptolyngbya sp. FACHB-161]MBD2398697.1 transcription antitermination protein NusB [Leptolyngbya sp. FACHB-239]
MQARRIARELALLSLSQISSDPKKINSQRIQELVVESVRTLAEEARDNLETAAAELQRGDSQLLNSQTRAGNIDSARAMVQEAITLAQTAINRLGGAIELPEFIQLANQTEVRAYTMEIITRFHAERETVDKLLNDILVDWNLDRLATLDRDLLRIATTEMMFLGVPNRVAINEAVELAKRYSNEDGHKFINGILRKVTDAIHGSETHVSG